MSRGSIVSKDRRARQARAAARAEWHIVAFQMARFDRSDGRTITIWAAEDGDRKYKAIGLESSTKEMGTADVLEDHGHKLIGEFASEDAAKRAAEGFARRWLRSGKPIHLCSCITKAAIMKMRDRGLVKRASNGKRFTVRNARAA